MNKRFANLPSFSTILIFSSVLIFAYSTMADEHLRKSLVDRHIDETRRKLTYINHGIGVQVDETSGVFNEGTADGRTLLYHYPSSPWSSHTIFNVDGILYCNSDRLSLPIPIMTFPPAIVETSIVCKWNIAGVDIIQRLTPVPLALGLGSLFIQYHMVNRSATSHQVGILLEMDTMINTNDAAPIATAYGYVNVAQQFFAPDIPQYWQAFEIGPDQPASYMIGQGILYGWGATMPDRFAYGAWGIFESIVEWNPTSFDLGIGDTYWDSAVLIWWNPRTLLPGDSTYVGTYYGLGSMEVVVGILSLRLLVPASLSVVRGDYSPNPFTANLTVTNAGEDTAHNVSATISLPSGLVLLSPSATVPVTPSTLPPGGSGNASWQIRALDQPRDTVLCVNVTVGASDAESNSIFRCVVIPMIERIPPVASIVEPFVGAISSCPRQRISMQITDPSGVDGSSLELLVNGVSYTESSPGFSFTEPNLVFVPQSDYADGDTVEISLLHARDRYYNDIAEPVSWYFISDQSGPYGSEFTPPPGTITNDTQIDIGLRIQDRFTQVDSNSILLRITTTRGEAVYDLTSPALVWSGNFLTFYPESIGYYFIPGDTVSVSVIRANDMPDLCDPNPFQASTGRWSFYLADEDTLPPRFRNFQPESTFGNIGFNISCDIYDESGIFNDTTGSGVYLIWDNDGELTLTYNIVRMDSVGGSGFVVDDSTCRGCIGARFITTTPVPPQRDDANFVYIVHACDNDIDLDNPDDRSCGFSPLQHIRILNTEGPMLELISPYPGAYSSCPRQPIRILLYDPQGVQRSRIELYVAGQRYDLRSPELSYDDSILTFTPHANLPEGPIIFRISDVYDMLGNVTPGKGWQFISDQRPPEISNLSPSPGSEVPDFSPEISFSIADSLSGLDTSSISVIVNSRGFRVGDDGVSFEGNTFTINTASCGLVLGDGAVVNVSISARDRCDPAFCPPNALNFSYMFRMSYIPCERKPNPITPNGDGKNDYVVFRFPNMRQEWGRAKIEIYELNGKKVRTLTSSTGKDDDWAWDGFDANGEPCKQGLYVYLIKVGNEVVCSGTIGVVR